MFPALWALKPGIEFFSIARAEPMQSCMKLGIKCRIGRLGSSIRSITLLKRLLHHLRKIHRANSEVVLLICKPMDLWKIICLGFSIFQSLVAHKSDKCEVNFIK